MVIQTNEHDFKGKTLQEYLEWKYPTKEERAKVKKIDVYEINKERGKDNELDGGELDLREFKNVEELDIGGSNLKTFLTTKLNVSDCVNLTKLYCSSIQLTSLDVSDLTNLTHLDCSFNNLTSIDFLNQLPHPEKMIEMRLANNNIQPTNLEFLRPFVNLEEKLTLGNDISGRYNNNIYNRFYGSLEPLKNMTKLEGLCIDGTDVEEGLEYLPVSVNNINCSPMLPNQKVVKIQNELRPFNYDIKAWQLAHLQKMYQARPELFEQSDTREKWSQAVKYKIIQTKTNLTEAKKEVGKEKKTKRLESKLRELELIQELISQKQKIWELENPSKSQKWLDKNYPKEEREELKEIAVRDRYLKSKLDLSDFRNLEKITTLIELENSSSDEEVDQVRDKKSTENKTTQTDLTSKQIKILEQIQVGVKELAKK